MTLKHTLLIPFLLFCFLANAESYVYVTDTVDIPIRSDSSIQSNPSNLLRMLPSGTKLQLLSADNGWTKVRFEQTTGWMISRYLTSNLPAKMQLEALTQNYNQNKLTLARQQANNTKLEQALKILKNKHIQVSMQSSKHKAEKEHVEQVYQEALKLEYQNEKFKNQVLQLKTEIQLLQNNQSTGQESSSRNWFIVGAIILFIGILFGLILPKFTHQRRF